MNSINLLPFTDWSVSPRASEPAHGYFSQLIALAGSESVRTYATMIDVNGRNLVPEDLVATISELPIGNDAISGLRHFTPVLRDGEWRLGGEVFGYRDISFSTRRRCPACTHEAAYHRAWWDIVAIMRCPYHGLEIVDTDAAGRKVLWWWPHFDVTESGDELGIAGVPSVLRDDTFARYMLGRLGCEPGVGNGFLDGLVARDVIEVCDLFGRLLSNDLRQTAPERTIDTLDHGYRALMGGLVVLKRHVEKWLGTVVPKDMLDGSAQPIFGWAFSWTKVMTDQELAHRLRGLLRAALSDTVLGIEGGDGVEQDIYLTETAAILGIDRGGLYEVVNALAGSKSEKRRRLALTRSQVDALAVHVRTLMTRQEAAKALGLPSWELSHLEKAGYLTPIRRMSGGAAGGARFLRRDVDKVLAGIEALPPARDGGISVLTHARKTGLSRGQAASAILNGDIVAGRIEGDLVGFRAVRVVARETYAYRKTSLASGDTVSTVEVIAITNLDYQTVTRLAATGRLGPENRAANLRTFGRSAVENFASLYRPIVEFASPTGQSVDDVYARLSKANVELLAGGSRWSHAVRKSEALAALGLSCDPTMIQDPEFDGFWADLLRHSASDVPHYRLPPRLPAAGQLIWRSNRQISVLLRFNPVTRCLQADIGHGRVDGGQRRHLAAPINEGPHAVIDFLSSLNDGVRRARSPPHSAAIAEPTTTVSNNEVPT